MYKVNISMPHTAASSFSVASIKGSIQDVLDSTRMGKCVEGWNPPTPMFSELNLRTSEWGFCEWSDEDVTPQRVSIRWDFNALGQDSNTINKNKVTSNPLSLEYCKGNRKSLTNHPNFLLTVLSKEKGKEDQLPSNQVI